MKIVNFIEIKSLCVFLFCYLFLISFFFFGWFLRAEWDLREAHAAFLGSSVVVFLLFYLPLILHRAPKAPLEAKSLYLEFTMLFLLFPLLIFIPISSASIIGNGSPERLTESLDLYIPAVLSPFLVWFLASLVIQGSERVINRGSSESEPCRDDLFHYIYKQNLQVRCFLGFLLLVAQMKVLYDSQYAQIMISALGIGLLIYSVSELFLLKKIHSIKIEDGFEDWINKTKGVCRNLESWLKAIFYTFLSGSGKVVGVFLKRLGIGSKKNTR